jgi:hypothetical protein
VEILAEAAELPLVAVVVHRLAPCRPVVSAVARHFVRCRRGALAETGRFIPANASHRRARVRRDRWSSVRKTQTRMQTGSARVRSRLEILVEPVTFRDFQIPEIA